MNFQEMRDAANHAMFISPTKWYHSNEIFLKNTIPADAKFISICSPQTILNMINIIEATSRDPVLVDVGVVSVHPPTKETPEPPHQKMNQEELTIELGRAYRCIQGMHNAITQGIVFAVPYHALTIGAAKRFIYEGELDGSNYFKGKHVSVLHDALKLGEKQITAPPEQPKDADSRDIGQAKSGEV